MNTKLALFGAALSCLVTASSAMAYNLNYCRGVPIKWGTNGVTMRASATSFPTGYWRDGLQRTVTLVNQNPSPFYFTLVTDTGGVAVKNGENEVWGSTNSSVLQGSPAITHWQDTCYWLPIIGTVTHRDEADVVFDYNSPFQWTADELKASIWNYGGTRRQLQSTGIHEFGHALGLLHVNTEYNIMGTDFEHIWANGSTARGYLGEDASDGAVALYGPWSASYEDLGVAHWKYASADGQYSHHVKTGVYDAAGTVLPTVSVNGEAAYRVNRGQTVQVEFTYENNGKNRQTVNTGWYISDDDFIQRTDRRIAVNTGMTLVRNDVLTYRRTLTIPADLRANTNYWLGTIVDIDSVVPDNIPSNNATYIPIHIN